MLRHCVADTHFSKNVGQAASVLDSQLPDGIDFCFCCSMWLVFSALERPCSVAQAENLTVRVSELSPSYAALPDQQCDALLLWILGKFTPKFELAKPVTPLGVLLSPNLLPSSTCSTFLTVCIQLDLE